MIHFTLKFTPFKFKRSLPETWADMTQKEKIDTLRHIFLLGEEAGRVAILKKLLRIPEFFWQLISMDDKADLLDKLSFMSINPSTTLIFPSFEHKNETFYLPKEDFINGSVGEFILALDYYQEYGESQDGNYLLKLVAVLAREKRADEALNIKFGDVRVAIHDNSDEAEVRADKFKDLPHEIIIAVLRYFEGVKQLIHDLGIESELWKKPETDSKKINNQDIALFGWRTILRNLSSTIIEYDALFQRVFWEIFEKLREKKASDDALKAQYEKMKIG